MSPDFMQQFRVQALKRTVKCLISFSVFFTLKLLPLLFMVVHCKIRLAMHERI